MNHTLTFGNIQSTRNPQTKRKTLTDITTGQVVDTDIHCLTHGGLYTKKADGVTSLYSVSKPGEKMLSAKFLYIMIPGSGLFGPDHHGIHYVIQSNTMAFCDPHDAGEKHETFFGNPEFTFAGVTPQGKVVFDGATQLLPRDFYVKKNAGVYVLNAANGKEVHKNADGLYTFMHPYDLFGEYWGEQLKAEGECHLKYSNGKGFMAVRRADNSVVFDSKEFSKKHNVRWTGIWYGNCVPHEANGFISVSYKNADEEKRYGILDYDYAPIAMNLKLLSPDHESVLLGYDEFAAPYHTNIHTELCSIKLARFRVSKGEDPRAAFLRARRECVFERGA